MDNCSCQCTAPDEWYTVLQDKIVRARKEHRCEECSDIIKPGQLYEDFRGVAQGYVRRHKTCSICLAIRRDFFQCGWIFGELVADFRECMGFDYRKVPGGEEE